MFKSGSARILYSLFCCLSLLTGDYAFRRGVQPLVASADVEVVGRVRPDRIEAPALKGDQAISWLRHRGVYDSLRSSIEADRYQMQWEDGAYQATNPSQNLRARFTPTEMSVAVVADERRDRQLGMKLTAFGYPANLIEVGPGKLNANGNRIEIDRSTRRNPHLPVIKEWYVNRGQGLEQGFTIPERPSENPSRARLTVALAFGGDWKARLQADRRGMFLESNDGRQVLSYDGLHAYDARGLEMSSEIVLLDKHLRLEVDDAEAVYPLTIDPVFTQVTELTANDGLAKDMFGNSVAVSGDIAVVGAVQHAVGANQSQGSVYVFARNQGGADKWGEVKQLTASDGGAGDNFGGSVAISGDTIIVGAPDDKVGPNAFQGSAYVFYRNQGGADNWGEVKHLTASDGAVLDFFGNSAAISGDTIVVGADSDQVGPNSQQGSAYVFERNQGGADNWGEVKKLIASDGAAGDLFSFSIAISGDNVVVGAVADAIGANTSQGSAYVFGRNQGGPETWGEVKKLTASDGALGDSFGQSVGISSDTVVVGADFDDVGANAEQGSAYVFERNQGGVNNWGEVKHLIASGGVANEFFGTSVAIGVDTIIVGAPGSDVPTLNQGAAYAFQRDQGGAGNWGQVTKITASTGATDDLLGVSAAIDGDTIIMGTVATVGANDNQGSAYIFGCDCTPPPPPNDPPQISPATISRQQDSPSAVETIATVSDDLTPAGSLVVTVTSVPLGISISSISNTNGTITASISVACSAALGANLVGLKVTDSGNATATGNLTINVTAETTPPTITCPTNVTVVAAHPGDVTVVVNYPTPVATDNCSVPTVVCNPPSGSAFPLGTTTVTCTATDAANNTATCSFTVTVFDVCLQDDSSPGRVLVFNSLTGDYVFCCNGQKFIGKGSVIRKGSIFTLTHYPADRRVTASVDASQNKGSASLQAPPGSTLCTITDKDTRNNTCACAP